MTDISRATADELRTILAAFRGTSWPLTREALATLAQDLQWRLRSSREKGATYLTGLGYRNARADCLLREDQVLQVTVGLTERADGDDAATRARVRETAQDLVATASEVLGAASGAGVNGPYWELPTSSRLAIDDITDRVILRVLSPWAADIERAEERQGIDPDRVVGVDPDPA